MKKTTIILILPFLFYQCFSNKNNNRLEKEVIIYNAHNEVSSSEFRSMNLDEIYPSLIAGGNSDTLGNQQSLTAWTEFVYAVHDYLDEIEFEWAVPDSSVSVFLRAYFDEEGSVEHLLYKVKSDNVSLEKKKEFGEVIKPFLKKQKINIKRENKFAQCGRTAFWTD